jgi:integrase
MYRILLSLVSSSVRRRTGVTVLPPSSHYSPAQALSVRRYGRFGAKIRQKIVSRKLVDPRSVSVLKLVPRHSILVAVLLATTRLRYSELMDVRLSALFGTSIITIATRKGSAPRRLAPMLGQLCDHSIRYTDHTPVAGVSRATIAASIARAAEISGLPAGTAWHHSTHLFRHLWATAQFERGVTIEEIGAQLGHRQITSTASYIHRELSSTWPVIHS